MRHRDPSQIAAGGRNSTSSVRHFARLTMALTCGKRYLLHK